MVDPAYAPCRSGRDRTGAAIPVFGDRGETVYPNSTPICTLGAQPQPEIMLVSAVSTVLAEI